MFADLKMVKQTDRKSHWAMESNPESIKGIIVKMRGEFPLYYEAK